MPLITHYLVCAMPTVQQVLLQFVNILRPPLTDLLLDDTSCLLVNQIDVSAVWWFGDHRCS